jgi:hypothetical protein
MMVILRLHAATYGADRRILTSSESFATLELSLPSVLNIYGDREEDTAFAHSSASPTQDR